jgi:hypothetical protein
MAAEMLSDEQISDFKDAFTHFDLGKLFFCAIGTNPTKLLSSNLNYNNV